MNRIALALVCAACSSGGSAVVDAGADAGADARADAGAAGTIYDAVNGVTWLADMNLAKTNPFGLPICGTPAQDPCVNASGSMDYPSATEWVNRMNAAAYLGHTSWQLPTTPPTEPGCTSKNTNDFGFECQSNALGSLYYGTFQLSAPAAATPTSVSATGPFQNYKNNNPQGNATFSFNTGFQGANTQYNFLYVLPMIPGKIAGASPPSGQKTLFVNPGGQSIYDPVADVTWAADANLASSNTFGLPRCTAWNAPTPCVAVDGSMDLAATTAFIAAMNAGSGYLGQTAWQLPPADLSCDASFGCIGTNDPLAELYYGQLALTPGMPVVPAADATDAGFIHVQPYLYWSCQGPTIAGACSGAPATSFQWSFSFGDGFLGTDLLKNELYVAVYYVGQ